jgi:hypothetical protein
MPACWRTGWGCRASRPWARTSPNCPCSGVNGAACCASLGSSTQDRQNC